MQNPIKSIDALISLAGLVLCSCIMLFTIGLFVIAALAMFFPKSACSAPVNFFTCLNRIGFGHSRRIISLPDLEQLNANQVSA